MSIYEMIDEYQCPGCLLGCAPSQKCESVRLGNAGCEAHRPATFVSHIGRIALGLPKAFDRIGPIELQEGYQVVRLWANVPPEWDHLNVPVWAMERDGCLFVRTFAPRINTTWIDVVQGGTLELVKSFHTINVAEFIDDID